MSLYLAILRAACFLMKEKLRRNMLANEMVRDAQVRGRVEKKEDKRPVKLCLRCVTSIFHPAECD